MVLAECLRDIVATPYQDHMNDGASSNKEEHAQLCDFITCIELLPSDFPHRETQSHQCHCQPCKQPHNDKRLDCIGGESHFAFKGPKVGSSLSNSWVLGKAEHTLCLNC